MKRLMNYYILEQYNKRLVVQLVTPQFIWDEGLFNHKHCLLSPLSNCKNFRNNVLTNFGDWKQYLPIL